MRGHLARVRAVPAALSSGAHRAAGRLRTWRTRRADAAAKAICPADSWAFTPLYSNGRCPLCDWEPEGYRYAPPLLAPYDRYWGALAGIATISVVMCISVVLAYLRG